jgi:uncharacterized protein YyaL (SSP411 family)
VSAEQINRLAHSASPYLRSAAHQPVQWYEWGEEAFARARAEDKPILLDIGAVWCHWCHVIDRESYENPALAAIINQHFVPVKVDRDERPDVDARYQTAISAVSGQGGWPLTGFLLSDGRPFYGGTYFPPEDAMGRPSFRRVLEGVAEAFRTRRDEVEKAAGALFGAVQQAELSAGARGTWTPAVIRELTDSIVQHFDPHHGGFGSGPKFPHSATIDLLLERYQATGEPQLLLAAQTTLEKMARGGVYDQLGGGFHRYSVDERWLVPHFEKMSYDNSELLRNYLHGYAVTRNPLFRETALGIIRWVDTSLSNREHGGFYSSQDADISLDDDGDYFTWTLDEIRAALPADLARVIELYYDVGPRGEMHHNPAKNVLWVARDPQTIAEALGTSVEDVVQKIETARRELLGARQKRTAPYVDTTIYTSWNAMFISAYLEAAQVLGGEEGNRCRLFALRTLDRLIAEAWDKHRGFSHRLNSSTDRVAPNPDQSRLPGTLDDQVLAAVASLDAFEATLDMRYFEIAERVARLVLEKYADDENGGFFDRASDAPPLGGFDVRRKPIQDSPTPAGNSVAVMVLDRLYEYTGTKLYRDEAHDALEAFSGIVPRLGMFAATCGLAAVLHTRHPLQIVVTGALENEAAQQLERAAALFYRSGKAVLRVAPKPNFEALPRSLSEILPEFHAEKAQAFVCVAGTCFPPAGTPEKLTELLGHIPDGTSTSAAV